MRDPLRPRYEQVIFQPGLAAAKSKAARGCRGALLPVIIPTLSLVQERGVWYRVTQTASQPEKTCMHEEILLLEPTLHNGLVG